jgi:hypothetical protein
MDSRFFTTLAVDFPVVERSIPIQHYLRQPQRLVKAIAHTSQMDILGGDRYRLRMRPLHFLSLTLQPVVEMQVWLDKTGHLLLKLLGELHTQKVNDITHIRGCAELEVAVAIPFPLSLTPQPLIEVAGQSLLKGVLATMKQRLSHHLLADYELWAEDGISSGVPEQLYLQDFT